LNSGPQAFFREDVAVANAAGQHLDPHLTCARFGNLAIDDLEICSGPGHLRDFHRGDCDVCRRHVASIDSQL
jgi:hypothetical protein